MTYARDWWRLISVGDRAAVLAHVESADTGPLPAALATRILRAGADLISVDGAAPDRDSPFALSDEDTDWIIAHGSDAA